MNTFEYVYLRVLSRLTAFLRKLFFAALTGIIIGAVAAFFQYCLREVIAYREAKPYIIAALPIAGLLIVAFYKAMDSENDAGTNLVIESISTDKGIPFKMAPLIFVSTIITHMYGGSAGREGAALQIGGSLGNSLGRLLKLDDNEKTIFILSGMSAAFSGVFGTPVAAAIFAMEVTSVGAMQYSAIVPCTIASITANEVATHLGGQGEHFAIAAVPHFSFTIITKILLLCIICAGVSALFCILLHAAGNYFKMIENQYYRIVIGGTIIVILTTLLSTRDYSGAGMDIIERAVEGEVVPYAFAAKMIFTAITLGCGYKGGEIVPSFFVGATLGCLVGQIIGFNPGLCAAVGMICVFCGVTNCPIASLLIAIELFGVEAIQYFLLAVSVSYMLSGYYSLYHTQKFTYSKYAPILINKRANKN